MINALLQQQQADSQGWARAGTNLSRLGQGVSRLAGTDKTSKFKAAGQKLFELGGLTEKNLKIVIKMYDLAPEETRELIATCQTMATFLAQEKTRQPLPPNVIEKIRQDTGTPIQDGATMEDVVKIVGAFPKKTKEKKETGELMIGPGGEISYTSRIPGTTLSEGQTPLSVLEYRQKKQQHETEQATKRKGISAKASKEKSTKENKQKESVKKSLEKAIGNYERAVLGIDQFLDSPNKKVVVKQEQKRIFTLAKQYAELGGNLEELGVESLEILNEWFTEEEKPPETEEAGGVLDYVRGLWQKEQKPSDPSSQKKTTATNPKTGETLYWNGKQWLPLNK
jgi:hypothetical protein